MIEPRSKRRVRNAIGAFVVIVCAAAIASSCATGVSDRTPQVGDWRLRLTWRTETETGAFGYFVYRSDSPSAEMVCINQDRPLPAAGTTNSPQRYVYYDLAVDPGAVYYYKLQQIDMDGRSEWIVGHPEPIKGTPKQLTEEELAEISANGLMYRRETG